MTTIAPCPFCGCDMEKSDAFSNRSTAYFVHPRSDEDDECIASSIRVPVSDREDDKRRLASWNHRTPSPQPNVAGSLRKLLELVEAMPRTDRGFSWELRDWRGNEAIHAYGNNARVLKFIIDNTDQVAAELRAALATTEGKDNG